MRIFIFLLTILIFAPAVAQEIAEELPSIGEGPKGRFTKDQGQLLALNAVQGEVLETDGYWQNDRLFFVYKILDEGGSVYEVEINSLNGKVRPIEIESLVPGAELPFDLVSKDLVEVLALDYVLKKTRGRRKPELISSEVSVFKRRPVYKIAVKKLVRRYELFYDAQRADFIEMKKLD